MPKLIRIINAWVIRDSFTVVEVEHSFQGLPQKTEFTDGTTLYHINQRILFAHTAHQQRQFKRETTSTTMLSFKDEEAMKQSASQLLGKETMGIYQYTLMEKVKIKTGHYEIISDLN
ncbi:MAG: hypothetical protein K0S32_3327 [Bacteroidetes bacterium]|jgi:hypothetical protein|nr:hypothetical protein [Bacteroidota bacterium]